jgi:hypothetical protein
MNEKDSATINNTPNTIEDAANQQTFMQTYKKPAQNHITLGGHVCSLF